MTQESPFSDEQVREATKLLMGATKDNPVKSREIANRCGINDADGHPQARALIREVMERTGVPLGGDGTGGGGYYTIATQEDLDEYVHKLDGRIHGIQNRKAVVISLYYKKYPDAPQLKYQDIVEDED